jgi:hypothetical protein
LSCRRGFIFVRHAGVMLYVAGAVAASAGVPLWTCTRAMAWAWMRRNVRMAGDVVAVTMAVWTTAERRHHRLHCVGSCGFRGHVGRQQRGSKCSGTSAGGGGGTSHAGVTWHAAGTVAASAGVPVCRLAFPGCPGRVRRRRRGCGRSGASARGDGRESEGLPRWGDVARGWCGSGISRGAGLSSGIPWVPWTCAKAATWLRTRWDECQR